MRTLHLYTSVFAYDYMLNPPMVAAPCGDEWVLRAGIEMIINLRQWLSTILTTNNWTNFIQIIYNTYWHRFQVLEWDV